MLSGRLQKADRFLDPVGVTGTLIDLLARASALASFSASRAGATADSVGGLVNTFLSDGMSALIKRLYLVLGPLSDNGAGGVASEPVPLDALTAACRFVYFPVALPAAPAAAPPRDRGRPHIASVSVAATPLDGAPLGNAAGLGTEKNQPSAIQMIFSGDGVERRLYANLLTATHRRVCVRCLLLTDPPECTTASVVHDPTDPASVLFRAAPLAAARTFVAAKGGSLPAWLKEVGVREDLAAWLTV